MPTSRARAALFTAAGAVLLASVAAVALPAGAAAAGCSVNYAVSSQWQGGFGANVVVTNLGDPLSAWTLTWSYSAGQQVTQAWNTALTQSGALVTAKNVSYNGSVATNGTVSFGFNGSWTGSNPNPASFALNGVACTGGVSGSPTPSSPSSPSSPSPSAPTPPASWARWSVEWSAGSSGAWSVWTWVAWSVSCRRCRPPR